jgi:hypothetical protein
MNYGKNSGKKRPPNWSSYHSNKKQAFAKQVRGMSKNLVLTPERPPLASNSGSSSCTSSTSSSSCSSSSSDTDCDLENGEDVDCNDVDCNASVKKVEDLNKYFDFGVSVSLNDAYLSKFKVEHKLSVYETYMEWVSSESAGVGLESKRKQIEMGYSRGACFGLGKQLNRYVTDLDLVCQYVDTHITVGDVMSSFDPTEDKTSKFWYEHLKAEQSEQPVHIQKKRRDNIVGGISKFLAFCFVIESEDFATYIPPFGSIRNVANDFKLIDSYLHHRTNLKHRAISIVQDLSKLNFFIKRIVAAFYCVDKKSRSMLMERYKYIPEVVNATPALSEYISMRMKDVRSQSVLQHNEKYSIAGMKEAKLWVPREKIKLDRKTIVEKLILFRNVVGNKSYPLEAIDDQSKKDQRTFAASQCLIIALVCNTCYGNRTQVMQKLKLNERRLTCSYHRNCQEYMEQLHEHQHVEWDLDKVGREKRARDRKGIGLVEPDCITSFLDWFITATQDFRLECKDPSFVFFPLVFHYGAARSITFRKSSNFQNTDVNKAIRYTNAVFDVTIPKPSVMRHLYCTHEYLDWYESSPGVDNRDFDKLLEDLSYDMNTTVHEILNTYLVCNYSRYQLHDHEARVRAASKVNKTLAGMRYT